MELALKTLLNFVANATLLERLEGCCSCSSFTSTLAESAAVKRNRLVKVAKSDFLKTKFRNKKSARVQQPERVVLCREKAENGREQRLDE